MPTANSTQFCGGSADCVTEMTSLAAQVTHWKIAGIIALSILFLVFLCLWTLQTSLGKRRASPEMIAPANDDVEQGQQVRPILVDVTCARPTVISVEQQRRKRAVREITVTSRKPVKRCMSTLPERVEAGDDGDDEASLTGDMRLGTGLPINWFEMDSYSDEHVTSH